MIRKLKLNTIIKEEKYCCCGCLGFEKQTLNNTNNKKKDEKQIKLEME
ncbi:MAG TPA: hypothetical protein VGB37_07165 [Candidatus Lokiarchaeia archaeon]